MTRQIRLISVLIFWIIVLAAIIITPEIGVIVAIIGGLVFVVKKMLHIPF